MTIDERSRHQLFLKLEAVLGAEEATTLMEHLPPVGWADVATKTDLAALEQRVALRFDGVDQRFESIDQRFESMDQRFDGMDQRFEGMERRLESRIDGLGSQLRAEFQRDLRTTMLAVMAVNAAVVSAVAAIANLF